jgi:hypothetical protein
MGVTFTATSKAADAPDVEPGLYDARFDGVSVKFVEGGQFGDGDRFEWAFTLLDDEGAVLYDDGDPITVTGLTSLSTNTKSKTQPKAVRYLKALMTAAEFSDFEQGKGVAADAIIDRTVQVEVTIRDSGWPTIANVLPPRKKRVARTSEAE